MPDRKMLRTSVMRWVPVLLVGFMAGAATVMLADPGTTEARVFVGADAAAVGHDHAESTITYDELPADTKAEVDGVIAAWATKHATAADAENDGWFKATKNLYGIGAHYIRTSTFTTATSFDMEEPNILLFDGEGPDAEFAGLSWIVREEPEGFAGSFDSWHSHTSVCLQGGIVTSVSEEGSPIWFSERECRDANGRVLPLANSEMIHLWIGPEYIDDAPIFAHDHPKLYDGFKPKGND